MPYEGINPFFGIGLALSFTTFRKQCGIDVSPDAQYWTGYWRHHGCSDDSQVADHISQVWGQEPVGAGAESLERLAAEHPDIHAEVCRVLAELQFPDAPSYSADDIGPEIGSELQRLLENARAR